MLLLTMLEPRRTFVDNKSTDPIRPALFSRPGHDYGHIARFAVCDPVLGAINYIMIAFPDGSSAHVQGIRTGTCFGQCPGANPFSRGQMRQPFYSLFLISGQQDIAVE